MEATEEHHPLYKNIILFLFTLNCVKSCVRQNIWPNASRIVAALPEPRRTTIIPPFIAPQRYRVYSGSNYPRCATAQHLRLPSAIDLVRHNSATVANSQHQQRTAVTCDSGPVWRTTACTSTQRRKSTHAYWLAA
jgi:hypothetical protein